MKKSSIFIAAFWFCLLSTVGFAEESGLKWNGDVRYRHEMNSSASDIPSTVHLQKVQARLGASAAINENAKIETRLATGTGATSTNQALGENKNFQDYTIKLNRAFFDLHTASGENVHLYGGRVKNTFYSVAGNDLLFDSDLNFDGLAFTSEYEVAPGVLVGFNQGFYWYSNNSVQDSHLISPQILLKGKWDALSLGIQGSYLFFDHMSGQTLTNAKGNSVTTTAGVSTYNNDYRVWDAGMELGYDFGMPSAIFFDYATNSAISANKKAYIAGLKVGKLKEQGDFLVSYDFRKLEADAFVGAVVDGDCASGGTDVKCHRVRGAYQLNKGLTTGVTYYLGKKSIATVEKKYNRLQIDLTFVF